MLSDNMRVLFLSHGGGPLPLLNDAAHLEMVKLLELLARKIKRPSAVLIISAHWEMPAPSVTSRAEPSLIYDYYGFPEESYSISYPCPGHTKLAARTQQLLRLHGFDASLDNNRGLDHGVFVPMKIMYPEADIPCVQLSLLDNLDPTAHIEMGRALSGLDMDNLLIIGSGFSFHNLRAFFVPDTKESRALNDDFESWLIETCSDTQLDENQRSQHLINWQQAPGARYCHPREEHLLPLHVCYGVTQSACSEYFTLEILNKRCSVYLW